MWKYKGRGVGIPARRAGDLADIRPPHTGPPPTNSHAPWACAPVLLALLLSACTQYPSGGNVRLHLDMVDQPTHRPQNDPRPLPPQSVPLSGWEQPMTRQQAELAPNPVPPTPAALQQAATLFGIYCTPCHGASGRGDGVIAAKMVKPADLTAAKYAASKDGFFYDVMRAGSGLMPPQYENLSPAERWTIVHHIRRLQSR